MSNKINSFSVLKICCVLSPEVLVTAMLSSGIDFEEVAAVPGTDPTSLDKSPLGKIPCIETPRRFLSETGLILAYIEACYP
ncbi:hypothetical protein EYZ66_08590 [Aequoribacter fuscus]|nr:glutathione S-transferase N-terminal domain-containing protein [Aequoribacter fuscus]QHJ88351.1 hypothetical protein EYZ66_08590 [Aequoribacter fuscus]